MQREGTPLRPFVVPSPARGSEQTGLPRRRPAAPRGGAVCVTYLRDAALASRVAAPLPSRLPLVLLAAGVLLVAVMVAIQPGAAGGGRMVVGHGPAEARYDAANGTTLAVFLCGHWSCQHGFLLEGDRRADVDRRGVVLDPEGPDSWRLVPVEPFPVPGGPAPVREAYAGPFEVRPTWPFLAALLSGVALVGMGLCLLLARRGAASVGASVAAPVAGALVGAHFAGLGEGGLLLVFAAPVLAMVALTSMVFKRPRRHAVPVLVSLVLALVAMRLAQDYLPSGPAL